MESRPDENNDDSATVDKVLRKLLERLRAGEEIDYGELLKNYPEIVEDHEAIKSAFNILSTQTRSFQYSKSEDRSEVNVPKHLGEYEIIREVGRGGMGIVFEARHRTLQKRFALKVLPFSFMLDDRSCKRFQNEALAAGQLEHSNIVPVFSVEHDLGIHFYVMQFVEGHNLARVIRKFEQSQHSSPSSTRQAKQEKADTDKRDPKADAENDFDLPSVSLQGSSQSVPLGEIALAGRSTLDPRLWRAHAHLIAQVADGLQHAHDVGIIHRDIKPSNLILDDHGNIWIVDFGLAQIQGEPGLTMTGDVVGTLRYMSPEQALAKRVVVDHRTDIYSLGCTLYELLTLKPAIEGATVKETLRNIAFEQPIPPRKHIRQIPVDLETIVLKSIAKNPDERYSSANEMAADLNRFLAHEPIHARRATLLQRADKWVRRHRGLAAATMTIMALTMIFSLVSLYAVWRESEKTKAAMKEVAFQNEQLRAMFIRSEALRLAAKAELTGEEQPALSLLLASEAVKRHRSPETHSALFNAMNRTHETDHFQHSYPLRSVDLSSDGVHLVTTGIDLGKEGSPLPAILWSIDTGEEVGRLVCDTTIEHAFFSPDGVRVLTTSSGNEDSAAEVVLWDSYKREQVNSPGRDVLEDAQASEISERSFSPDGSRIVLPATQNRFCIYDSLNGGLLKESQSLPYPIVSTRYSADGTVILTLDEAQRIGLWASDQLNHILTVDAFAGSKSERTRITQFDIDDSHSLLLACSSDREVEVWNLTSSPSLRQRFSSLDWAAFSPSGQEFVAFRRFASELRIHDAYSGELAYEATVLDRIGMAVPNKSRQFLVLSNDTGAAVVWDVVSRSEVCELLGHQGAVTSWDFEDDDRRLVSSSADRTTRAWTMQNADDRLSLPTSTRGNMTGVMIASPHGSRLAIGSEPRKRSIVFSTDGRVVYDPNASASMTMGPTVAFWNKHRAWVWDSSNQSESNVYRSNDEEIVNAVTDSKGRWLAVLNEFGQVRVTTGETNQSASLVQFADLVSVRRMSIIGIHDLLLILDDRGQLFSWNLGEGRLDKKFALDAPVHSFESSPVSSRALIVLENSEVVVLDVVSDEVICSVSPESGATFRASFVNSANQFVILNRDRIQAIEVRDASDGSLIAKETLPGFTELDCDRQRPRIWINAREHSFLWEYLSGSPQDLGEIGKNAGALTPDGTSLVRGVRAIGKRAELLSSANRSIRISKLFVEKLDDLRQPVELDVNCGDPTEIEMIGDNLFVVNSEQFGVSLVDFDINQPVDEFVLHAGPISRVVFLDEGRLAMASWDGSCSVFEAGNKTPLSHFTAHDSPIIGLDYDASKEQFVTAAANGEIKLWREGSGIVLRQRAPQTATSDVAFALGGSQIIARDAQGNLQIWRSDDGKAAAWRGPNSDIDHVFLSTDRSALALVVRSNSSISDDRTDDSVEQGDSIWLTDNGTDFDSVTLPDTLVHIALTQSGKLLALTDQGLLYRWPEGLDHPPIKNQVTDSKVQYAQLSSDERILFMAHFGLIVMYDLDQDETLFEQQASSVGLPQIGETGMSQSDYFGKNSRVYFYRENTKVVARRLDPLEDAHDFLPRELTPEERDHYELSESEAAQ